MLKNWGSRPASSAALFSTKDICSLFKGTFFSFSKINDLMGVDLSLTYSLYRRTGQMVFNLVGSFRTSSLSVALSLCF